MKCVKFLAAKYIDIVLRSKQRQRNYLYFFKIFKSERSGWIYESKAITENAFNQPYFATLLARGNGVSEKPAILLKKKARQSKTKTRFSLYG